MVFIHILNSHINIDLSTDDLQQYMNNEKLEKAILADLNKLALDNKFNSLEKIKQVHLTLDLFT